MREIFLADDGETVIVSDCEAEDEEYFCYSKEELAEMYGEEAIPEPKQEDDEEDEEVHVQTNIDVYYDTLVDFLNAVGKYIHLRKLGENADNGTFHAQKVIRDYGYEDAKYDIELDARKCRYLRLLLNLSVAGEKIGFSPIDDDASKQKILRFVKDRDRRRYIRDLTRRCKETCDLISINGMISRRIELEKKKQ